MSDEANNDATTGETTTGAAAEQPSYVTSAQLESTLNGFKDSLFSMVRKMNSSDSDSSPKPPAVTDGDNKTAPEPSGDVKQLRRELAIEKALVRLGLEPAQESMLKTLAMTENPHDLDAWAAEKSKLFAAASPETTAMADNTTSSTTPAPAAHSTESAGDDVTKWSHEEYDRQFQMNAKVPANKYDVRNREYYKEIRNRAEGVMSRTNVYVGPDRG